MHRNRLEILAPHHRSDAGTTCLSPKVMADAGEKNFIFTRGTDGADLVLLTQFVLESCFGFNGPLAP